MIVAVSGNSALSPGGGGGEAVGGAGGGSGAGGEGGGDGCGASVAIETAVTVTPKAALADAESANLLDAFWYITAASAAVPVMVTSLVPTTTLPVFKLIRICAAEIASESAIFCLNWSTLKSSIEESTTNVTETTWLLAGSAKLLLQRPQRSGQ